jgi:hypothetical protein
MKGVKVNEYGKHTHFCVVGEGVFLQGNFDILMFGTG